MDLVKIIEDSLENIENERREISENSGWMVQYCPCGHSRELDWSEKELVEKAKNRKSLDALPLSSENCPICKGENK